MTTFGTAETRLINRRCRCGGLLVNNDLKCQWHAGGSARYAADLLLYLVIEPARPPLSWRRVVDLVTGKKDIMNLYTFEYLERGGQQERAHIRATNSLDAFDAFRADHPFVPIANIWVTFGS